MYDHQWMLYDMKTGDQRTTNCRRSLQSFKLKTYIQMKSWVLSVFSNT